MKRVVFFLLVVMAVQAEVSGFQNKINLLKSEGEEGWMEKVIVKGKTNQAIIDKELSRETRTTNDPYTLEKLSPSMQALDLAITRDFKPNAAIRPKRGLAKFKENWNSKNFNERQARSTALISAASNIPKLANAKEDPVGAIQGVLNIMASVSQVAGPTGQLVSIGFMFVSSLLGLFGLGNKPKPIGEIVREQINEALAEFHDQLISDQAGAAILAFRVSKGYVDGAGQNRDKISDNDVNPLVTNVPVLSGVKVMGLLATQIDNLKRGNNINDAKKCFKYVELYFQLATMRSMIMSQVIGLIPETYPATIDAYANAQLVLQEASRSMLEFLYNPGEESKLMPYFDGEKHPFTDSYMKTALSISRPNRFPGSGYCITAFAWGKNYLGKFYETYVRPSMSHPIARVSNTAYCKWRLVPHGNNLFSITSEDGMLSYDNGDVPVVSIEKEDPTMWEIQSAGGSSYWIKMKYFCGVGNRCNYGLRYKWYYKYSTWGGMWDPSRSVPVLAAYLHAVSNQHVPWVIYKSSSDMPTVDDVHGKEKDVEEEGNNISDDNESWTLEDENGAEKNVSKIEINKPGQQPKKNQDFSYYDKLNDDGGDGILTSEGQEGWLEKLLAEAKQKESQNQGANSVPPDQGTRKTEIHKKKKKPGNSQE